MKLILTDRSFTRHAQALLEEKAYADGLRSHLPEDPNSPIYWEAYCKGLWQYHMQRLNEADKARFNKVVLHARETRA